MFGYVRAVEGNFSEEAKSRYQAAYCGLCHTLGRRCGVLARFTLNYDFTLLAMLFAPPEPVSDVVILTTGFISSGVFPCRASSFL